MIPHFIVVGVTYGSHWRHEPASTDFPSEDSKFELNAVFRVTT